MNQIISYYVWEFGVILGGVAFMCLVRSLHSNANKIRITDETTEQQTNSIVFPETTRPLHIDEFGLEHAEDKAVLSKNPRIIIWNGYVYSGVDSIRRKTFEKTSNDMLIIAGEEPQITDTQKFGFYNFGVLDYLDRNALSKYGTLSKIIRVPKSDIPRIKSQLLFFGSRFSATLPFFLTSNIILI